MKSITKLIILLICSVSFAQTNLLDTSTWTVGMGSVSGFNHYGTDVVNVREQDTGPHGTSELLWKRASGISSTSSGGWITDYVSIDYTKTYRFAVWAKKINSQDGRFYFAFDAKDSSGNYATNYLISGTSVNNPYFKVGDLPTLDNWYLLVSHVHPSGYTGTTHTGGVYDINGVKVSGSNDFKFQSGAIQTRFKMYFYDQTNIGDHGSSFSPTIYEVNGQEPTIQELIDGPDTQVPTASTLSSNAQTDSSVALSWTAATDNIAVTGYKVYKDAVLETTLGNVLSYQVTGLTASTAYNFTVTALDAAGNESVVSNILNITTNSTSSFDPAYQAILNEATAQGYTLPSTADQNTQNQVILSAKASGIWTKSDLILYFKGSGDKSFKLINWKNPAGVKATEESFGGALTWSSTGVKSDGINLINTHFNSSVGGLNYTQNNAGLYVKVSEVYTTKFNLFGGSNVSLSTTGQRPVMNSDGSLPPVFTFSGTDLFGLSRNNATSQLASIGSVLTTLTLASGSVVSEDLKILGDGPVLTSNYTRFDGGVAYVIIGGDMSDKLSDIQTAFDSSSSGDTQAPTASTLSSTAQIDTTVDLSWTAATDNTAVTGYKVYKNAVLETTLGNILSYQVAGLTASTAYNFTVTALDAAGNESVASNTLAITTNVQTDTQAPTAPTVSSSSQTDTTVDLSWTAATDNTAVTGYKVYKDAVLESTLGNVLSYQITGLAASTAYNFTVTALDAAGNESVVSNTLAITTNATTGGGSGNWTLNNQNVYYNTGNVGIGTTTPDEKLTVKGSIHSEEVKVDLSVPGPDYVFNIEYKLTPLEELRIYIEKNKHLPNIPPAKEMEANGIELGIMNMKLLEKIEELTLYILQQQKKIDQIEKRISKQEKNKN